MDYFHCNVITTLIKITLISQYQLIHRPYANVPVILKNVLFEKNNNSCFVIFWFIKKKLHLVFDCHLLNPDTSSPKSRSKMSLSAVEK